MTRLLITISLLTQLVGVSQDFSLRKSLNTNMDVYMIMENVLDSEDIVARAPKDGARSQKPATMKVGFSYEF